LKLSPTISPPENGINTELVTFNVIIPVSLYCHSLQYDAMQPAVNVPMW